MKVDLLNMNSLSNKVYGAINYSELEVVNTKYYDKESKSLVDSNNSYSLKLLDCDNFNPCKTLERVFNIINKETFEKAYREAVSGDGHEDKRILTLHSSSLCALLFFYNVKQYPLKLIISGREIEFNDVHFEVKNNVFDNPSNMDVVLISKDRHVILFLESKFSEYLNHGMASTSIKYKDYFEKFLKGTSLNFEEDNDELKVYKKGRTDFYAYGIKQMIAHYIGVNSFIKNKKDIDNKIEYKNQKIYLGEIVFDAWNDKTKYAKEYSILANNINATDKTIKLLPEILTYQEAFKNYPLEENIREYYKFKKNKT